MMESKIYLLYENQDWLAPMVDLFTSNSLAFEVWSIYSSTVDFDRQPPPGIYLNKLSASAMSRDHIHSLEAGSQIIFWLEQHGSRVINGTKALALEQSKFKQHLELRRHDILAPYTKFIVGGKKQLADAAKDMKLPFVYKYDCGGKGIGVRKFSTNDEWLVFLESADWQYSPFSRHIIQDYVVPSSPHITRCEFIGGKFHYAIHADTTGGFELCPAEACQIPNPVQAEVRPTSLFSLRQGFDHPIIQKYQNLLAANQIDIAGIEFIEDQNGQIYTYDINCNTNYSPDIEAEAGQNSGLNRLADFLKYQLGRREQV